MIIIPMILALCLEIGSFPAIAAVDIDQESVTVKLSQSHKTEKHQELTSPPSGRLDVSSKKLMNDIAPKLAKKCPVGVNMIIISFIPVQDLQSIFGSINLHIYDEYSLEIFDDLVGRFMRGIICEEKQDRELVIFLRRIAAFKEGQSVFRRIFSRNSFSPLEYSTSQVCEIYESFPDVGVKLIPFEKLPSVVRRFLSSKLVYKPYSNSNEGMVEFPIAALTNPLAGTFDLKDCGETNQHFVFNTGYRTRKNPENKKEVEVWFVPRFLIERNLSGNASHFKPIFNQWSEENEIGIFWTWGGWNHKDQSFYYDYLFIPHHLREGMCLYRFSHGPHDSGSKEKVWIRSNMGVYCDSFLHFYMDTIPCSVPYPHKERDLYDSNPCI